MKTEGTYEIRAALSIRDQPTSRMRVEYLCESCGFRRLMMRGQTPHRSVAIELAPDGFLLSVEYLHPDGVGPRPTRDAEVFPQTARCPDCLTTTVKVGAVATFG
jgi:hypothetical protein